jgi:anti-sigma regulatory factor (Ser/Thr protein kinase)
MTGTQEIVLPPRATSPREARRWVAQQLEDMGLQPFVEQAELLSTELVTNALLHAGTTIRVRVAREGQGVRIEVQDGSRVVPSRRLYSPTATTGRGTRLLDSLADEWGWETVPDGKVTWLRLENVRDAWGAFELDDVMNGL